MSKADKSFELYEKLKDTTQKSNSYKIIMGEYLYRLKESKGYEDIAGEGETWTTFLAMPEIAIPYTTAARYIKIAEVYVHKLGLSYEDLQGLDVWKLETVANKVTKQNVKEWLERIPTLSRSDIQTLVQHGEVDQMKCKHANLKVLPIKYKCLDCGIITLNNPNEIKI